MRRKEKRTTLLIMRVYLGRSDENEEGEQSVPSQNTPEEFHNEEGVEEEVTQEETEKTRVSTPEQPD